MKACCRLLFLFGLLPSILQAQYYYGVNDDVIGEWNVGLHIGLPLVKGDVTSLQPGYQGGIYLQRSFSRILDIRLQVHTGKTYGLDLNPSHNFANNPVYNGFYNPEAVYDTLSPVFYNYRMRFHDASLQFKLNLNRIFTRRGAKWDLYVLLGAGYFLYHTRIDALTTTRKPYDFDLIQPGNAASVKSDLKQMLDGIYETPGDQDRINTSYWKQYAIQKMFTGGVGVKFNLGMRFGIGLEGRYQFVGDDLLDGQQWDTNTQPSDNRDALISASLVLEYAFW